MAVRGVSPTTYPRLLTSLSPPQLVPHSLAYESAPNKGHGHVVSVDCTTLIRGTPYTIIDAWS